MAFITADVRAAGATGHAGATPDLLYAVPFSRFDTDGVKLSISLAFAAGNQGGLFADALERAAIGPTTFDAAAFANDLFLKTFVSLCFGVRIDGRESVTSQTAVARLLAAPPTDTETVAFRREILAELASDAGLRRELEQLYLALGRFRKLLESGAGEWDPNRRQLDLLALVREIVDRLAQGFARARSGLARLREFGERIRRGEPYQSLTELLAYDAKLASLKLEISVGADGKIRGFQLLSVVENEANAFVGSALRRLLSKLELFLRGYRFSDGEVMARLILAVFDGLEAELVPFIGLLGDCEFYLGALGFRDEAARRGLEVCLPEFVAADEPRVLEALFNPLLFSQGGAPVPCNVVTDRHDTTVLITGPNSGGKTRLLQSVALTQLLGQAGVFVPARRARLTLASSLVVSLIQETRADQAEGRLGMELLRIRALFERLPPGAMVMLDELCSGTNPSEGEEIFELVVTMLARLSPQAFITTHFLAFAGRLERTQSIPELRFLQVELAADQRPTYQFRPGVAATSLAGQAAFRLGVTADQLLSLVERNTRVPVAGAAR